MVTLCTTNLIFYKSTFCPHSVCMCFVWIRTNSDYFTVQHWLVGFYNWDGVCLLRGTDWVFIYSFVSLKFSSDNPAHWAHMTFYWTNQKLIPKNRSVCVSPILDGVCIKRRGKDCKEQEGSCGGYVDVSLCSNMRLLFDATCCLHYQGSLSYSRKFARRIRRAKQLKFPGCFTVRSCIILNHLFRLQADCC